MPKTKDAELSREPSLRKHKKVSIKTEPMEPTEPSQPILVEDDCPQTDAPKSDELVGSCECPAPPPPSPTDHSQSDADEPLRAVPYEVLRPYRFADLVRDLGWMAVGLLVANYHFDSLMEGLLYR